MKSFTARTGVRTHLTAFAGVEKLDAAHLTALYRVAQEALTNVARHAKATQAQVNIEKLNGAISLRIEDDGKGFEPQRQAQRKKTKHLGLLGMRERIEMLQGKFSVQSALGKGTTVQAEIPLGQESRRKGHLGNGVRSPRLQTT